MVGDGFHERTRKKKIWGIHDLSIQYAINNYQCPKTLQEPVDILRKVRLKTEKNNDKSNTKKQNKNGGGKRDKSNEASFTQTQKHEKK